MRGGGGDPPKEKSFGTTQLHNSLRHKSTSIAETNKTPCFSKRIKGCNNFCAEESVVCGEINFGLTKNSRRNSSNQHPQKKIEKDFTLSEPLGKGLHLGRRRYLLLRGHNRRKGGGGGRRVPFLHSSDSICSKKDFFPSSEDDS